MPKIRPTLHAQRPDTGSVGWRAGSSVGQILSVSVAADIHPPWTGTRLVREQEAFRGAAARPRSAPALGHFASNSLLAADIAHALPAFSCMPYSADVISTEPNRAGLTAVEAARRLAEYGP